VALSTLDFLTVLLLAAALVACWRQPPAWMALVGATLVAGYLSGIYSGWAAFWILLLGISGWLYSSGRRLAMGWRRRAVRIVGLFGIVILSLALGLHLLAGFHNRVLIPTETLTSDAATYSAWLDVDKTLAGVVVLGSCCAGLLQTTWPTSRQFGQFAVISVGTIVLVVLASVSVGYVRWEPKWTSQFWIWAIVNLCTTCVSEEVFFRGFLQTQIGQALSPHRWGPALAVAISATLFGLAHFAGGWTYMGVAAVAGVGYGLVLHRTHRLELSIVAHFSMNATHFLLFTYPRLA
jgi:uncharacterized protein